MPKTVSTADDESQLSSLVGYVAESRRAVIVEHQGNPRAVLISYDIYEEALALGEQRRLAVLDRLRALRQRVRARNQDLTAEQADALANRLSHDIIDSMATNGGVVFDRDHG